MGEDPPALGKDPLFSGRKLLAAINVKQQPRCCGHEFDRCSGDAFAVPRAPSTTTDPSPGPSGPVLRVNRERPRNQGCLGFVSFPGAGERVLQDEPTPEDMLLSADGHQVHGPNWGQSSMK